MIRRIADPLPIFAFEQDGLSCLYTPGYLVASCNPEPQQTDFFILQLEKAAREALEKWQRISTPRPPVCLTLYPTLRCSLGCRYCYAGEHPEDDRIISEGYLRKQAAEVLKNCAEQGETFNIVFHGGGEPTLFPRWKEYLMILRQMAAERNVPSYAYIATNGILSETAAHALTDSFDEIGLSLDGTRETQDRQRPLKNGDGSFDAVIRTAGIIRNSGKKPVIRMTITPESLPEMDRNVRFLADVCGAEEIHIEPEYISRNPMDPDEFCRIFLNLKADGLPVQTSGSRIREIHGRYCRPLMGVKLIVPGDREMYCFKPVSGEPDWDRLAGSAPECADCFNYFHCARGCPEVCPVENAGIIDSESFRCRVNRTLAEAELREIVNGSLGKFARENRIAGENIQ